MVIGQLPMWDVALLLHVLLPRAPTYPSYHANQNNLRDQQNAEAWPFVTECGGPAVRQRINGLADSLATAKALRRDLG